MTAASSDPWWRTAVIYQVYVRSYADGDGDGVGDLDGIRSRLDHLAWLGVDGLWLTPFFRSPMVDHGYDVADPRDVDPLFGDLDAFDALVADAHALGLRVLVDVVPNHTSDQRDWFREAIADPASPARARYIFRPGRAPGEPPNNWTSVFGGPAWSPDPAGSGEWYLHLFAPEQPDLDWRNPEVWEDAEETLRFWLDRGVDGFRIDVAHGLFKAEGLPDNPVQQGPGGAFVGMEQRHSFDQPEVHEVYRRWRALADGYLQEPVLVGEVFLWDPDRVAQYVRPDELHLSFGFLLMGQRWVAADVRRAIDMTVSSLRRVDATCTWVLSNHDLPRHATRFGGGPVGVSRARAGLLLALALPGAAFLYNGEELGLEDVDVPDELRQDPMFFRTAGAQPGRDGCRIPIPWDDSPGAGWSGPWLPIPDGWRQLSVARQRADEGSVLHLYRRALACRRSLEVLRAGSLEWVSAPGDEVLVLDRVAEPGGGGQTLRVVVNMGRTPVDVAGRLVLGSDARVTSATPSSDGLAAITIPPDAAAWLHP